MGRNNISRTQINRKGDIVKKKRSLVCIMSAVLAALSVNVNVHGAAVGYVTTVPVTVVEKTPVVDTFSLQGNALKFILLDCDEEGFFVSAKDYYGTYAFDAGGDGRFDVENPNNVAYWLNNEFLENGGRVFNDNTNDSKFELPEQIKEHLVERDWLCEAGYYTSDYPEDFYVRAKVALMSLTEWKKYNSKVGYADDTSYTLYYWLRTVNGTQDPGDTAPVMVINPSGQANFGKIRNAYGIKPVFYLDREFFLEEKLEISTMGSNVKKILRDQFKKDEFKDLYSKEDIEEIYEPLPPQANQISVTGIYEVGKILKGSYSYYSPENEPEANTRMRWLRSKSKNGPYSVIRGAEGPEFRVRPIDQGYYIVFEVLPKSETKIGLAVKSRAQGSPIAENFEPYSENVYIDGTAVTTEKLIARYAYVDKNDDIEDGTVIKWQSSDDGIHFSYIPDATGLNYVIPDELEGKYIRFVVWVKRQGSEGFAEPSVSDIIGPVKLMPKIDEVRISEEGGVVKLTSAIGENDMVCWETEIADGKYLIASVGGNEFKPVGNEKSIRARVYPKADGIMGKGVFSNVVTMNSAEVKEQSGSKTKNVSGTTSVALKSTKPLYAYSMIVKLKCDGAKIDGVTAEGYKALVTENNGEVTLVLTKTAIAGVLNSDAICTLNANGSGNIEIVSAEASYKQDGEIVKSTPELILE